METNKKTLIKVPIVDLQKKYDGRAFNMWINNTGDRPVRVRLFGNGQTFAEVVDQEEQGGGGSTDFNQTFYDLFGVHGYYISGGPNEEIFIDEDGHPHTLEDVAQAEDGGPVYFYATLSNPDMGGKTVEANHYYIGQARGTQILHWTDITEYISFLSQNNSSASNSPVQVVTDPSFFNNVENLQDGIKYLYLGLNDIYHTETHYDEEAEEDVEVEVMNDCPIINGMMYKLYEIENDQDEMVNVVGAYGFAQMITIIDSPDVVKSVDKLSKILFESIGYIALQGWSTLIYIGDKFEFRTHQGDFVDNKSKLNWYEGYFSCESIETKINYYLCKIFADEEPKYYQSYVGSDYLIEVTPEFPCIVKYLDTVPDDGWMGHWNAGGLYLQTQMPDQINFDFGTYIGYVLRNYVSVTYDTLKTAKQNGMLEPGMKYRITDYQTVANKNSVTANWRYMFDIVVTAIDNRTLSEDAEICLHELTEQEQEDEVTNYLSQNHKLGMWHIKYTLDYHASYWYDKDLPDAPTYKGLIYMMRDLNGIEMPYDFWNLPNGLQHYQSWATDAVYENIVIKAENIGDMPSVSFPHPDGSRPGHTRDVFVDAGCSDIIISGANSNINIGCNCSGIHTESLRDSVIMDGAKNLTLTGGNYGETTNITYKVVIMGLDYEDTGTSQPTTLTVPGSKDYTTYIGKTTLGVVSMKNIFD